MISGKRCYYESHLLLRVGIDTTCLSFQRTRLASFAAGECSGLISGTPHVLTQTLVSHPIQGKGLLGKLSHTTTEEGRFSLLMNQYNNSGRD